jgi:hypothetical protein
MNTPFVIVFASEDALFARSMYEEMKASTVKRRRRSSCVTAGETRRIDVLTPLNPEVGSTPIGVAVRGGVTTPSYASLRSACMGLRRFNACGVRLCTC